MPKGAPPKNLVVQPLVEGAGRDGGRGRPLGVPVRRRRSGADGRDVRLVRGSAASRELHRSARQQVIPGWDNGLIGQTVGSRVLLVVPPDDGYGTAGNPQAGIKGTDTLVFVVDILDAS